MKKLLYITVALAACGAFLFSGCARKAPDDKVLATVSHKVITLKDFKERLAKIPAYYRTIAERNKKRFLDDIIVEMLFYEDAVRKGLNEDKEVKEVMNEARKKILIAKLIKNEVENKVRVGEKEMTVFYENNKESFRTPELWRASHILVATEKEAGEILAELSKGTSFEELAGKYSMDATASRGGDVGYFRQAQLVPDFEKACLELKVGQMSGVVHTQFGYHVIKLTDKKSPAIEPFEKVRNRIEDILKRKKRSELFDQMVINLKNKYGVRIEEDVFKTLDTVREDKAAANK